MLRQVDLSKRLDREEYRHRKLECQLKLRELAFRLYQDKRSMVVIVEGWDAAGKGGSIRRATEKMDPRGYEVYSIAAPEGEDRTHHYLWRFWRRLKAPDDKQIVIFDRSWYGRVLVERVEGFAQEEEWKRAFREINHFERQLTNHGIILVKLWFEISPDEQLRRFESRRATPHKRWKLTEEDWRNRSKRHLYEEALVDLLRKTSTLNAPWTIIEGNDKYWERIKTMETLIAALEASLGASEPESSDKAKRKSSKKKSKG